MVVGLGGTGVVFEHSSLDGGETIAHSTIKISTQAAPPEMHRSAFRVLDDISGKIDAKPPAATPRRRTIRVIRPSDVP